jgi:hypothetical protein
MTEDEMSKEFAARHVTGRMVTIHFTDQTTLTGKAMALVNTGHGIAISVYVGFRKYPLRAQLNDIARVIDLGTGREIK